MARSEKRCSEVPVSRTNLPASAHDALIGVPSDDSCRDLDAGGKDESEQGPGSSEHLDGLAP